MMDYPCGKFGDCSFSGFGSIMRTDTQTQRHTDECYTPATLVSMNNNMLIYMFTYTFTKIHIHLQILATRE